VQTLNQEGNTLPGVNVRTIAPGIFGVRQAPEPDHGDQDVFFTFSAKPLATPTAPAPVLQFIRRDHEAALRDTYRLMERPQGRPYVIVKALTLTEAIRMYDEAKGLAF
jgi:hypothetical protein